MTRHSRKLRRATVGALISGLALVAAGGMAGAPASAGPDDPTRPDVVIATQEGDQKPFFPELVHLEDGRLVSVFYWNNEHSAGIPGGDHDGQVRWTESTDGGATWSQPRVVIDTSYDDRDAQITQLRDGTIVITWFQTEWAGYPAEAATIIGTFVTRSEDGGQTWSEPAQVQSSMSCGCGARSGAYHLGWAAESGEVVELDDGDLLIPLYGTRPDSALGRASVVRSTDGGRTWPLENEVMLPAEPGIGLSETELAVLPGGHVTAVIRPGYVSDSYDGGRTWTVAAKVPWSMQAPDLLTLPGGRVLLTYGGRDYGSNEPIVGRLLRRGEAWTDTTPVLLYMSQQNVDQGDPSTAVVRGGRFLTVSYDTNLHAVVGTFSSLADYVRAEPPVVEAPTPDDVLDLPAMVAAGEATFETDLTSSHQNHPTAQPGGAVDGVAEYWHSSLGPVATPEAPRHFTLSFAAPQRISWIGLNLKPGYAETASVYLSADGESWGDPVDVRTGHVSVAGEIAWAEIDHTTAQHVKIVITESAGASMLAELNIAR
ncbi:exo-alpha-sialidase [Jiangella ureilytica]|nr:exo-alpha-sialidase [Jiangella ureilytica]